MQINELWREKSSFPEAISTFYYQNSLKMLQYLFVFSRYFLLRRQHLFTFNAYGGRRNCF